MPVCYKIFSSSKKSLKACILIHWKKKICRAPALPILTPLTSHRNSIQIALWEFHSTLCEFQVHSKCIASSTHQILLTYFTDMHLWQRNFARFTRFSQMI